MKLISEVNREKIRWFVDDDDTDFVERWIEHLDIQCQIAKHLRESPPMASDHVRHLRGQIKRLEKGIAGLRELWQGRVVYQRTLEDTKSPTSDDIIERNNEMMSRAFRLWRETLSLKYDLEDQMPVSGRVGRRPDPQGLIREIAEQYEQAGFGDRTDNGFREIVKIALDCVGLEVADPSKSIQSIN